MKILKIIDGPKPEVNFAATADLPKLSVTGLFETGKVDGPAGPGSTAPDLTSD